ncbi:hypothetical protein ACEPAG_3773 [Sanghuangporus baumii]
MCSAKANIDDAQPRDLYDLNKDEEWWRDQHSLLKEHGYELRPRFRPGWKPSWTRRKKDPVLCEDGHPNFHPKVIDAIRISDGMKVAIKKLREDSNELAIATFLTSKELSQDPRNHTVPILDVFKKDGFALKFMVMPLLSIFDEPPFSSIDEVIDFMKQTLEGLSFMHENGVAHRDCSYLNIMMDGANLYPRGFHPGASYLDYSGKRLASPRHRRNVRGIKYYFTDFGISSRFDDANNPRLVTGKDCQDKQLPELYQDEPYDPFLVDIFLLGNVFKRVLVERYDALAFLAPLADTMTQREPKSRPTTQACMQLLDNLIRQQSPRSLLRLIISRDADRIKRFLCDVGSFKRELYSAVRDYMRTLNFFWVSTAQYARYLLQAGSPLQHA